LLVAATGHLRRFAIVLAMVAVSASLAAGCGGGGGGDTVSVKTGTQPQAEAPVPSAAPSAAPSASAFVARVEKSAPEQITGLCALRKAKGEAAAFANFKKGFELAFSEVKLPPKKVFEEIIKHCG
jgi:hypothetical protein